MVHRSASSGGVANTWSPQDRCAGIPGGSGGRKAPLLLRERVPSWRWKCGGSGLHQRAPGLFLSLDTCSQQTAGRYTRWRADGLYSSKPGKRLLRALRSQSSRAVGCCSKCSRLRGSGGNRQGRPLRSGKAYCRLHQGGHPPDSWGESRDYRHGKGGNPCSRPHLRKRLECYLQGNLTGSQLKGQGAKTQAEPR